MSQNLNVDTEHILEKVRQLSTSYGAAPYSIVQISLGDNFEPPDFLIPGNEVVHSLIGIMIWDDYSQEDLIDHISLSKEYLGMNDEQRNAYLNHQVNKLSDPLLLGRWKENQADLVSGIILSSSMNQPYQLFPMDHRYNFLADHYISKQPHQKLYQLIAVITGK